MVRPRRPLRWIADDLVRKTYFQKRRVGLIKKVKEFSTLCGVQGMCVIYNPYEEPSSFQRWPPPEPPTVWPSCESVVQLIRGSWPLSGVERSKKMFNQYEYLRELIMETEEKQSRKLKKIHDMELAILMDEVRYREGTEGLDMEQQRSLAWLLKAMIQDVQRWMQFLGATQGVKARDSSLQGLKHIIGETANDPIHIDENKESSSWLDGSDKSDDEHEGADLVLKL
ncbi:MADS-box transcription factor PHERES 1 [Linum grandiflorum]